MVCPGPVSAWYGKVSYQFCVAFRQFAELPTSQVAVRVLVIVAVLCHCPVSLLLLDLELIECNQKLHFSDRLSIVVA